MKKENIEKKDLLDTLRYLNGENINESKELKDNFFDLLIQNQENLPPHIKGLAQAWVNGYKKQYEGLAGNWLLNNLYVFQIARQLSDTMIKDEIDSLYLDERTAQHTLTYLASIQGQKELVEEEPQTFDTFKHYFLLGLITRYANYGLLKSENKNRFEKLVNIYVEQQLQRRYNIEEQEHLISYIDDEFMKETIQSLKLSLDINKMESILYNLVQRNSPLFQRKTNEELFEEYRKKLSECTDFEEKKKIYEILDNILKESQYYFSEYERKLR